MKKNNIILRASAFFLVAALMFTLIIFADPETVTPDETSSPADTASTVTLQPEDTRITEKQPNEAIMQNVKSALLVDARTMTVMYEKNSTVKNEAGVSAKLMTALICIEKLKSRIDEIISVPKSVAQTVSDEHMDLKNGEEISIGALLHGLIMYNAGDAALVLALNVCENTSEFVALMNEKAAELGMASTKYTSVYGATDDNSYTTASDVLLLANEACKNELYRSICAETTYDLSPSRSIPRLYTRNYFLSGLILPYYQTSGINGLCAGYTSSSGGCGIFSARFSGVEYFCIILGAEKPSNSEMYNFLAAKELFSWGNGRFTMKTILSADRIMGEVKVRFAEEYDYVLAVPEKSLVLWLKKSDDSEALTSYKTKMFYDVITAPVSSGEIVGESEIFYNGTKVGTVNLVTLRSLGASKSESRMNDVLGFLSGKTFLCISLCIISLLIIGILVKARMQYIKNKSQ